MALNTFGWTPAEVTTDSAGNAIAGAELTVWEDLERTTPIQFAYDRDGTTLLPTKTVYAKGDTTTALTSAVVTSGAKGRFGFIAQDTYSLVYVWDGSSDDPWPVAAHEALDSGSATHAQAVADAQAAADSAAASAALVGAPADSAIAAAVNGAATSTRSALNGLYEVKLSTLRSTGTSDQAAAINTFLAAASPLGVKQLIGAFNISGPVTVPSGTVLDGSAATLTVTVAAKSAVTLNSNTTVNGLTIVGLGTDYVASSSVYSAAGFSLTTNATNVTVRNCKVSNVSGAGVYAATPPTKLRVLDCELTGLGAGIVPAGGQWSGGVIINNDGAVGVTVRGGSISGYAQGISTGNITDARVTGVRIYDIAGQHGIYFGSASRYAITGNLFDNTYLEGIKVQIGTTSSPDAVDGTISGNTISRCGSHGIHLAQTAGGTPRHRRVSITGNTVTGIGSGANLGDGVYLEYVEGAQVIGNHLSGGRNGIYATTCIGLTLGHNRIVNCADRGIGLISSSDVDVLGNRIKDVATSNYAATEFGINIDGATAADIRLINNKVTDAAANMRYGLYMGGAVTAANQGTMTVLNNVLTGASDYGARLVAGATTARWSGNTLGGTSGAILSAPTNYATNPDTTGAALAALETEVNELKAVLRANGLIAP